MATERITKKIHDTPLLFPCPSPKEQGQVKVKALRDSLDAKRRLLALLQEGGYVKDVEDIKAEVNRAIADLDEIIRLFPEEKFEV